MAALFWVGGSNAYDGVTNRFATTSGGSATVALVTSADTVTFDANSPASAVVTTSAAMSCTTLTLATGFTGSVTFSNNPTVSGDIVLQQGTLDMTNRTVACARITMTGTATRTLTITGATVTCSATSGTSMDYSSGSGLTVNASGSTVNIKTNFNLTTNSFTWGTVNWALQGSSASYTFAPGGTTFGTLAFTGIAARNCGVKMGGTTPNCTVTGTLSFVGNSTVNRLDIKSTADGTARTITVTGAAITKTNVVFKDITFSGTPASETDSLVGDAGGNTGMTFTTPAAQTYSGTSGGNWSANAWTTRVPLPQDDVTISSAFSASQTITMDMTFLGKNVDFTGTTGNPAIAGQTNMASEIQGSLTLVSGMTTTSASGNSFVFGGRSAYTITWAGVSMSIPTVINCPGGSYTLTGNYTQQVNNLSVNNGYFYSANYAITIGATGNASSFNVASSTLAGCVLGTSTVTMRSTGVANFTIVSIASAAYFEGGSSTFEITGNSPWLRSIIIAGQRIGTVNFTALSPGGLGISNSNFFHNLNIGSGRVLQLQASTTQNIKNITLSGTNNGYQYIPNVNTSYASVPDSAALSITGDVDLRIDCALDDWTPATSQALLSKFGSTNALRDYRMAIIASGVIRFQYSTGAATVTKDSTVAPTVSDGGRIQLRVFHDVDNGAAGNDVKFYYRASGTDLTVNTGWTQLGTTVTTAGTTTHNDSATEVRIGADSDGTPLTMAGKIYQAVIVDASGTVALNADFTAKAFGADTFTESSANAATVTINGDAGQAGDGRILVKSSSAGTSSSINSPMSWHVGANSVNKGNCTGIYLSAGGTAMGDYCTFKDFNARNNSSQLNTLGVG